MAPPINTKSRTGQVRELLAKSHPKWVDSREALREYITRTGDVTATKKDVSTTLSQLEKRGLVESMLFNGASLKSWRLTVKGLEMVQRSVEQPVQGAQHEMAPVEVPSAPDKAVVDGPAERPEIDLTPVVGRVVDQIVEAFRAQLEQRLSAELERVLATQASAALEKLPQTLFREPKGPLRQVTIVGLLAGQASMIEQEYRKEFRMQFVDASQFSGSRLKSLSANSEAVVTMTNFVPHAVEDVVKSSGGNLVRCQGGLTHLRETLDELYLTEQN